MYKNTSKSEKIHAYAFPIFSIQKGFKNEASMHIYRLQGIMTIHSQEINEQEFF